MSDNLSGKRQHDAVGRYAVLYRGDPEKDPALWQWGHSYDDFDAAYDKAEMFKEAVVVKVAMYKPKK